MRWAIVGAEVRKACAISSVVSPQTSRSVSATCASGGRAGWQQMKISLSWSSSMVLSSQHLGFVGVGFEPHRQLLQRGIEARLLAHAVDRLEAPGRNQPGERIGRHAVLRPLRGGRDEGVVHRLLGAIEIAEQPDQRRQHAARMAAVDRLQPRRPTPPAASPASRQSPMSIRSSSCTGRTSIVPTWPWECRAASRTASLRVAAPR